MAPAPQAMRRTLLTCEGYAAEFCILFNASKSKCVMCMSHPQSKLYDVKFTLIGNVLESVKSWPHLGHIIACGGDDGDDIDRCRYKLISQI